MDYDQIAGLFDCVFVAMFGFVVCFIRLACSKDKKEKKQEEA